VLIEPPALLRRARSRRRPSAFHPLSFLFGSRSVPWLASWQLACLGFHFACMAGLLAVWSAGWLAAPSSAHLPALAHPAHEPARLPVGMAASLPALVNTIRLQTRRARAPRWPAPGQPTSVAGGRRCRIQRRRLTPAS